MISSNLINDTLILSKQSSQEERKAIIKDIEQKMENETSLNVLAFFDWYISLLNSWNEGLTV